MSVEVVVGDNPLQHLHDAFGEVCDPRLDRTKAPLLIDIIGIAVCAVICGADSWVAVAEFGQTKPTWLAQFLALRNGIPSHDTFGRVFAALDAEQFQQGFVRWVRAMWPVQAGEVIARDGKTVRGSHARTIGKDAIHMVSAWAHHARLTLAQCGVDAQANEITALPELLRLLHLQGSTVTMDAMGCQTAIARQIVEQKADYVLALKENHEQLYADVVDTFAYVAADGWQGVAHDSYRTVDVVRP